MTLKRIHWLFAALALPVAVVAASATAAGNTRDVGTLSDATAAQRTIKMDASTKYLNAEHLETLAIENDKGQRFVWTFNTFGETSFPLKAIAPTGFDAGEAVVYVKHPPAHRWPAY